MSLVLSTLLSKSKESENVEDHNSITTVNTGNLINSRYYYIIMIFF